MISITDQVDCFMIFIQHLLIDNESIKAGIDKKEAFEISSELIKEEVIATSVTCLLNSGYVLEHSSYSVAGKKM